MFLLVKLSYDHTLLFKILIILYTFSDPWRKTKLKLAPPRMHLPLLILNLIYTKYRNNPSILWQQPIYTTKPEPLSVTTYDFPSKIICSKRPLNLLFWVARRRMYQIDGTHIIGWTKISCYHFFDFYYFSFPDF